MIYSFFFIRKVVAHVVPFMLYCVVIPLSVLIPEVTVPVWGVVYIPTTITLLYAIRNPRFASTSTSYISHRIGCLLLFLEKIPSMPQKIATVELYAIEN